MINFVFYFSFLLNLKTCFTDYITYPLIKIKNEPQNDEITTYIFSEIFDTHYFIKINLPNNNSVNCSIIGNNIDLSINESINDYYLNSSPTFETKSEICSDIFPLNSKNINDISSIIETRLNFSLINSNNQTCKVGIGKPRDKDDKSKNLITQIKNLNLTNSYIFTFNYNKNYFRFGDLPEFNHPEKYKKEDFYFTHSYDFFNFYFQLMFFKLTVTSKINDEVKELDSFLNGRIEFGINYIVGPNNFKEIIKEEFFNNYTDLCKEENITYKNKQYSTFYCENQDNLKKNFPLIAFYHTDLVIKFSFNSDDLFTEIKPGKYLFNIIFPNKGILYWRFGGAFVRKYPLFLNINNSEISYYNGNYTDGADIINGEQSNYLIIKIIFIAVLACVIFVLGYLFGKQIYQKRMKRTNELDDDKYDYSSNLEIND